MIPTVNAEKAKQRISKKTIVATTVWFVLLGAAMTFIAFAGHL